MKWLNLSPVMHSYAVICTPVPALYGCYALPI